MEEDDFSAVKTVSENTGLHGDGDGVEKTFLNSPTAAFGEERGVTGERGESLDLEADDYAASASEGFNELDGDDVKGVW